MKIRNKIILLFVFLSTWGCTSQTAFTIPSNKQLMVVNIQPYLGQSFPGWKEEYGYIVNPHNSFIKRIVVIYDGIEYDLGISINHEIEFIATSDKRFSVNGYKVGDVITKTNTRPGWGSYTKIDDEWYAAWLPEEENRNEEKGRIQWFFKFDFENDKGAYPPVEDVSK